MRERLIKTIQTSALVLGIGLLYFLFFAVTGKGIPCPILKLTGWYCPGCGATRMLVSLAGLDFSAAVRENMYLPVTIPLWLGLIIWSAVTYVKSGRILTAGQRFGWSGFFVGMLAFGILRNLPAFQWLAPS